MISPQVFDSGFRCRRPAQRGEGSSDRLRGIVLVVESNGDVTACQMTRPHRGVASNDGKALRCFCATGDRQCFKNSQRETEPETRYAWPLQSAPCWLTAITSLLSRMIFCTSFRTPLQLCLTGFGGPGGGGPEGVLPFLHGHV